MDNDPSVWLSTHSLARKKKARTKKKINAPTQPSVSGLMDAWIFFFLLFRRPIYLILIGITLLPWCSCRGVGGLSDTRDSNEISQTLHHVEFLMIILRFVDNQQNVLNRASSARLWIKWRDYMTHFFFLCA